MLHDIKQIEIILASSSPRRRELLAEAGYKFKVVPPAIPEPDEGFHELSPMQQAEALAYFKAREVADTVGGDFILGADTIVALGDEILGKPRDEEHARQMLGKLSGSRHKVVTGLALLRSDGRRLIASDTTIIQMKSMSPADIQDYIDTGEWQGKAGAYAIQETADKYIAEVQGSFSNVVGLPLELLEKMLMEMVTQD